MAGIGLNRQFTAELIAKIMRQLQAKRGLSLDLKVSGQSYTCVTNAQTPAALRQWLVFNFWP
jgi:hypothetical protein